MSEWLDDVRRSILAAMADKGLSQTKVARASGVSIPSLNGFLNRKRSIGLESLARVIDYLRSVEAMAAAQTLGTAQPEVTREEIRTVVRDELRAVLGEGIRGEAKTGH